MSFQSMAWAVKQKTGSPMSKFILLMLANYTNDRTGQCNPSHQAIAEECEISVSCIKTHIKALEAMGLLTIVPRSQDGVSLPNQYVLHINSHPVYSGPEEGGVGRHVPGGGSRPDPGVGRQVTTNQEVKPGIKPTDENPVGFASFWSTYPKKVAKPAAIKAWRAARLKEQEIITLMTDIDYRLSSDDWTKDSGRYVPNPATYLNQRRWEDNTDRPQYGGLIPGAI